MPSPPSVAGELPALRTGGGEGRKGEKERGEEEEIHNQHVHCKFEYIHLGTYVAHSNLACIDLLCTSRL